MSEIGRAGGGGGRQRVGGCIGDGRKWLGGLLEPYYREIKGSNSSCDDFY